MEQQLGRASQLINYGVIFGAWGWIAQQLIAYGCRRYSLIKTLIVDLVYRSAAAVTGYHRLCKWYIGFSKEWKLGMPVPILKTIFEEHVLYKNVQGQMVECLWGKEVQTVRDRYRWLGLIEQRVEMIHTEYANFVEKTFSASGGGPTVNEDWVSHEKEIFKYYIAKYGQYLAHLVRPEKRKETEDNAEKREDEWIYGTERKEINDLEKALHSPLFIGIISAYSTQVIVPVLLILGLGAFFPMYGLNLSPIPWEIYLTILAVLILLWGIWFYFQNIRDTLRTVDNLQLGQISIAQPESKPEGKKDSEGKEDLAGREDSESPNAPDQRGS